MATVVERLVVANFGWIRERARIYHNNIEDAEELAGETILKCLCHASRYDPAKSFRPWAAVIMENTYKSWYVRRSRVLFTSTEHAGNRHAEECSDQTVAVHFILASIRRCLRRSRSIESVILYAKGYDYSDISLMLGIPVGTVKSRIATGRRILRREIED